MLERMGMQKMTCPLCEIPKTEKLLYEDDLLYLVETKDKKSHKVRAMVCIKRHDSEPTFQERIKALCLLNEYMQQMTDKWFVCDSTYATIKSHFHYVACDLFCTDIVEAKQLFITEKVLFPINFKRFNE